MQILQEFSIRPLFSEAASVNVKLNHEIMFTGSATEDKGTEVLNLSLHFNVNNEHIVHLHFTTHAGF